MPPGGRRETRATKGEGSEGADLGGKRRRRAGPPIWSSARETPNQAGPTIQASGPRLKKSRELNRASWPASTLRASTAGKRWGTKIAMMTKYPRPIVCGTRRRLARAFSQLVSGFRSKTFITNVGLLYVTEFLSQNGGKNRGPQPSACNVMNAIYEWSQCLLVCNRGAHTHQ